jgi:hypothetical protein
MYLLFVAVANTPAARMSVAVAIGALLSTDASLSPDDPLPLLLELSPPFFLVPSTPPTTAAMMTASRTGTPNLIHGLRPFFFVAAWGVINPVDDSAYPGLELP